MTARDARLAGIVHDITAGHHGGNPESTAANTSIHADKTRIRTQIVAHIRTHRGHGATCDEVERDLGLSHQTASARITEATALGLLTRSGARRLTRSGRNAAVHVAVDGGAS